MPTNERGPGMRLSSGPEHSLLTNRPVIVTQSVLPSSPPLPLQKRGSPYSSRSAAPGFMRVRCDALLGMSLGTSRRTTLGLSDGSSDDSSSKALQDHSGSFAASHLPRAALDGAPHSKFCPTLHICLQMRMCRPRRPVCRVRRKRLPFWQLPALGFALASNA